MIAPAPSRSGKRKRAQTGAGAAEARGARPRKRSSGAETGAQRRGPRTCTNLSARKRQLVFSWRARAAQASPKQRLVCALGPVLSQTRVCLGSCLAGPWVHWAWCVCPGAQPSSRLDITAQRSCEGSLQEIFIARKPRSGLRGRKISQGDRCQWVPFRFLASWPYGSL